MGRSTITIIGVLVLYACALAIINIPDDYPAIQQGIDAAVPGDTILIWPGTYTEDLEINQKDLILGSRYLTTGDTSYIGNTALDGDSTYHILTLNGPHYISIYGLLFTHGYGQYTGADNEWWGGAISLFDSTNLQIASCRFIENYGDRTTCVNAEGYSSVLVDNCLFTLNEGVDRTTVIRTGQCNETVVRSSQIFDNAAGGTALIVVSWGTEFAINDCSINRNLGYYGETTTCMLLHASASRIEVNNCNFSGNTLRRQPGLIYLHHADSLFMNNCFFDSTTCDHAGGGVTLARLVDIQGADHAFLNNISIRNNYSVDGESFGIGIRAYADETIIADSIFVINNYEEFTYEDPGRAGVSLGSEGIASFSHIYVMDNSAVRSDLDEFPDETGCSKYNSILSGQNVTIDHLITSGNVNEFIQVSQGLYLSDYLPNQTYYLNDILIHDNIRNHPDPANDEWSGMGSGINTGNLFQQKIEINNLRIFNQHSTILGSAVYARCDTFLLSNAHISNSGNQPIKISADHFRMENVLLHDCWNTRGEISSHIVGGTVSGSGILRNCSIVDSYGDYGMGLYLSSTNTTDAVYYLVENCIIENTCPGGDALGYWEDANINLTVRYSNIDGGWEGVGNIDEDPMFTDPENGDYTFLPGSPCIDAGNPDSAYNDPEDPNHTGWPLWPSQGTLRNDMGCYGGPGAIELWEYQEDVPGKPHQPVQPATVELGQNYPNPFNPATTIEFTLPYPQDVRLTVYNILGQRVAIIAEGPQSAGTHQVQFNGTSLASGIYIYRLTAGSQSLTRKMVLVR